MFAQISPITLAVLASFFFASSTFIAKLIGVGFFGDPIHPLQVAHSRYVFGLITVLIIFFLFSKREVSRPNLRLHTVRATFGWLGVSIMFAGVVYIPASDAIALSFMNPIFAMFFASLLLGEQVGKYRAFGASCAFMGAVILLRPVGWQINPIALMCIGGAAALGLEIVIIKLLSGKEKALQILVISNSISAVIASVPLFFIGSTPEVIQWIALAAVGILMAFGQLLFLFAIVKAEASLVAPYIYATLIFITVLDFAVLKVRPDFWSLAGAVMIIFSGVYIALCEQKKVKRKSAI